MNGFLTQPDTKSGKRFRRSLSCIIPGWVQVALMAWMVIWGKHTLPIQSSYDPEHEYIAAGSGLDRLPKAAQSNSDGRAERARTSQFLELGLTVNGTRYWKIYGPDLNGAYGGLNGTGGLDGVYNQSTATSTFLINDTYGHGELTYTGSTYTWNPSLSDGYGVLPGSARPTAISSGTTNLASLIGWRGKTIDGTGFYYLGARYYAPDSGTFLSPDPLGHATSWDLYSYCNGDPVNNFDADGRFGKGVQDGWNGSISSSDPNSGVFNAGTLLGGVLNGGATGAQNGAGGSLNALSLGNVQGAFGSDSTSSEYAMGRNITYGGMATVAAVGTGGLALEAAGGTAGLYTTLTTAANSPLVLALGGATVGGGAATLEQEAGTMTENGFMSSLATESEQSMTTVTSWASKGVTPDLNPGRWVVEGEATTLNFIKTGLWGPKLTPQAPFIQLPQGPFTPITGSVPTSSLTTPSGLGLDGFIKALWGQKKLGQ